MTASYKKIAWIIRDIRLLVSAGWFAINIWLNTPKKNRKQADADEGIEMDEDLAREMRIERNGDVLLVALALVAIGTWLYGWMTIGG